MGETSPQKTSFRPVATEYQHVPDNWNRTQSASPNDRCLHQWFEAQVERTPDTVALLYQQEYLTYHEINRRANRLAAFLKQRGAGPDVLIGLCLPRTPELLIALLAILKAGAAYVPLDPTYPAERLSFILADAQVALVLTHSSCLPILPTHDRPCVCLDELDLSQLEDQRSSRPYQALATHLAYVIYTSGSTGRPKGWALPIAMLQHC